MKSVCFALAALTTTASFIFSTPRANSQFVFGPTSVEASPFNAFFVPTTSSTSNFGPPVGFYHYFFLPQYSAVYNNLYSDFEYDLPENDEIGYEFTIFKSYKY